MKKIVKLRFDMHDPDWPSRLHEAFDRLLEFTPELTEAPRPHKALKPRKEQRGGLGIREAYERIVDGDQDFSLQDVTDLCRYGTLVANAVRAACGSQNIHLVQGAKKAADNLEDTCAQFTSFIAKAVA